VPDQNKRASKRPEYLTPNEVAERWRVHKMTIEREARRGRLIGLKVGTQWRFLREEVEAYEERNRRELYRKGK